MVKVNYYYGTDGTVKEITIITELPFKERLKFLLHKRTTFIIPDPMISNILKGEKK